MRAWLIGGALIGLVFCLGGYVGMKINEPAHLKFLPPTDPGLPASTPTPLPRGYTDPLPDTIDT